MRKSFLAGTALAIWACCAAGQENNGTFPRHDAVGPVARIIVGLNPAGEAARTAVPAGNRVQALSMRTGLRLRGDRELGPRMRVVELETPVSGADLADALARLASDPDVAFAEPDQRVYRHALPNDPLFPNQWYLQNAQASALDAVTAWDTGQGGSGEVIALLDTGVRFDHPDLLTAGSGGRLLPGFDFVGPDPGGTFRVANDGDGWDADASDPGDWVTPQEASTALFFGCEDSPSSWHGTRVAGLVGAITDNSTGIAGVTWVPSVLPVRVLGKCFGYDSDILDAMRWAAGLHVAGAPDNPDPATILNMSLGASGSCPSSYKTVINELGAIGVLVVASAGNADGPVERPGDCPGVVAVAGLRHIGTKVAFSSFGAQVTVGAPGGNCVNTAPGSPCLFSLDTTNNDGLTTPGGSSYTDQFNYNVGTSFSAPFVAAVAALMQGVNPRLMTPDERTVPRLTARIREGAKPFPAPAGVPQCRVGVDTPSEGCACTTSTCGAGMANAAGGVTAALRPVADVAMPAVAAGQNVVLDGSGSAAANGRTLATYSWTAVCGTPAITGADTVTATVVAPTSGSFAVRLTVTDDQAAQDSTDITIKSSSATLAAPGTSAVCPTSGGGGGGGALGLPDLLILGVGAALAATRRRRGAGAASAATKGFRG